MSASAPSPSRPSHRPRPARGWRRTAPRPRRSARRRRGRREVSHAALRYPRSGSVMMWKRLPGRCIMVPSGSARSYSATSSASVPGSLPASRIRSYFTVAGMPATMPSIVSYSFEAASHRDPDRLDRGGEFGRLRRPGRGIVAPSGLDQSAVVGGSRGHLFRFGDQCRVVLSVKALTWASPSLSDSAHTGAVLAMRAAATCGNVRAWARAPSYWIARHGLAADARTGAG